jgi:hypothetical protein
MASVVESMEAMSSEKTDAGFSFIKDQRKLVTSREYI